MIYNEDAYYTGYYRNVRALGAVPALVFDTIAGLLRMNESGEISNSTLCEFLGCTKPTLLSAINKLIQEDFIVRTDAIGRGNKTIYSLTEKGKNSCPFMAEKRSKNLTEKVKKFNEKGKEILPINKELNKELKESSGDMRETQSPQLSITTTNNFESMEDFEKFWSLYPYAKEFEHEKESCERVWSLIQQLWRDTLIQQLENGQSWRKFDKDHPERNNPLWYLKNYNGETVQIELPFYRQGTSALTKWATENTKAGKRMCIMRYEGALAYCLAEHAQLLEEHGAQLLNDNWKFYCE